MISDNIDGPETVDPFIVTPSELMSELISHGYTGPGTSQLVNNYIAKMRDQRNYLYERLFNGEKRLETTAEHIKMLAASVSDVLMSLHFYNRTVEPDYDDVPYWSEIQELLAYSIDLDLILIVLDPDNQQYQQTAYKILSKLNLYFGGHERLMIDTIFMLQVPFSSLNSLQIRVLDAIARDVLRKSVGVQKPLDFSYFQILLLVKWWFSLPGCRSDETKRFTSRVPPGFPERILKLRKDVQFDITEYILDSMNDIQFEIQRYFDCMERAYIQFTSPCGLDLRNESHTSHSFYGVSSNESLNSLVESQILREWFSYDRKEIFQESIETERTTGPTGSQLSNCIEGGADEKRIDNDDLEVIDFFSIIDDHDDTMEETPVVSEDYELSSCIEGGADEKKIDNDDPEVIDFLSVIDDHDDTILQSDRLFSA
ncbi:Hypothetical protein NTJ_02936 [Nesidiocoris tenuis]|uniref:Uncharacterized protein n=1 Tax=Nesidiocoris tenuis TaxID=355587 RepID=A0ABN7ACX9_9HEMI|nr:Hypothetical protein NTJ_02936 [Nesidiocoris tenuis]